MSLKKRQYEIARKIKKYLFPENLPENQEK